MQPVSVWTHHGASCLQIIWHSSVPILQSYQGTRWVQLPKAASSEYTTCLTLPAISSSRDIPQVKVTNNVASEQSGQHHSVYWLVQPNTLTDFDNFHPHAFHVYTRLPFWLIHTVWHASGKQSEHHILSESSTFSPAWALLSFQTLGHTQALFNTQAVTDADYLPLLTILINHSVVILSLIATGLQAPTTPTTPQPAPVHIA